MMPTDVSIVTCRSYDDAEVRAALEKVLAPLGGLDWVSEGMTVAIKANLVTFAKPETATTTHPALLCALIRMLRARGAKVILGDSPGGLYNAAFLNKVYSVTGMKAAEEAGAELNRDFSQGEAQFPEAAVAHTFAYTAYLDRADAIIDFCKLKTHGMMGMSAAAKNMFGVVPGTIKPEYHFRFPDPADFARMIVDLNEYFKPRLSIVDAVVGMEGNGPTQGTPRPIGAIAASLSPHKLDMVCARLIGLSADNVPTLQAAQERGLIPAHYDELSIVGDVESLCVKDYKNIAVRTGLLFDSRSKLFGKIALSALASRPRIHKRDCRACKKCYELCPARAISMKGGKPAIDRSACIRCFCCQEFCPFGAIKVHRPLPALLLSRGNKRS